MTEIKEILDKKKENKQKTQDRDELIEGINGGQAVGSSAIINAIDSMGDGFNKLSLIQQKLMIEAMKEVAKAAKSELSLNFNGSERLRIETAQIVGAEEFMGAVAKELVDVVSKLKELKVEVPVINIPEVKVTLPNISIPDIKVPTVNVPKPEVTVNIPKATTTPIKVEPKITVNVPETKPPKELKIERDQFGKFMRITEIHDDGKVIIERTETGFTIDDKRRRFN